MEINGLVNIHLLLDQIDYLMTEESLDEDHLKLNMEQIRKQLKLLERYMLAVSEKKDLFWHEVIQEPHKFPTLREKVKA